MNFFEKRPLSIILCILLGGFSLFALFPLAWKWILFGIAVSFLAISIIFMRKMGRLPMVAALTLLLSFGLSIFYFGWYFPIYTRFGDRETMDGRITSVVYSESFEVLITVKTEHIDETPIASHLLVSYIPTAQDLDIEIDDEISFCGRILPLEEAIGDLDEKNYYEVRGIQGFVDDAKNIKITKSTRFSLSKFLADARDNLNGYIKNSADKNTAGLLSALITGDKSDLSGALRLNFRRIGLSHVLALSGMHLAILTSGLHLLLSLFTVDKKWRYGISMLFVLAYMGLTGFSISILRSGGMLLISNLLFLLAKTRDSFTNLTMSVAIICLISPYAVHDLSLLLSFFATVGVLIALQFLENIPYHISRLKKFFIAIGASLLSSFFAIAMTLPFSVFSFGRLSWIAPITTLIFSFPIEIFIYAGIVFLLIGAPPLLLHPISWLADKIAMLSWYFSDIPNVYTLAENVWTKIACVLFYVLLLTFIIFRIKHKKIAMLALMIVFSSVFLFSFIATQSITKNDRISYFSDTENNDAILFIDQSSVSAIPLTAQTRDGANYFINLLSKRKILRLDHLWIPQYYERLPMFLSEILSSLPVRDIYFPEPKNDAETAILSKAKAVISEYRCNADTVGENASVPLENVRIASVYRSPKGEGFRVILSFRFKNTYYTYLSNGVIDKTNIDLARSVMSISDTIIFGCNGNPNATTYYIEEISEKTDFYIFETDNVGIINYVYEENKDRVKFIYKPKSILLSTTS